MLSCNFKQFCWAVAVCLPGMVCAADGTASDAKVALPPLTLNASSSSYPAAASRAGIQGRVLVAFQITDKGRPDELAVEKAEPAGEFEDAAQKLVKQVRFNVPKNWEDLPESKQWYRLSVLFKLLPCQPDICVAPEQHAEAQDFLLVTAERTGN